MVRVEWASPALADLREIHDFIARDSLRYAQATVEKLTDTAERLARNPQIGEVLSAFSQKAFSQKAYRQLVVGAYRIIYREDAHNDRVVVMGVVHAARDLPPILENR